MTDPDFDVAIIGGGPGGLALAQGLFRSGFSVAVFERDRARTDYVQGFRLRVRDRGLAALGGLLPEPLWRAFVETAGRAPSATAWVNERLESVPSPAPVADEDSRLEMSVSRITLRQVLLSGLDEVVRYGRTLTGYGIGDDGAVKATFDDGTAVVARVLVGADGARSAVRRQFLPDAALVDTGARRMAGKILIEDAERLGLPPLLQTANVHIAPRTGRGMMVTSHRVDAAALSRHGLIGGNDPSHAGLAGRHFDNTSSYVWWNTAYWQDELGSDDALAGLDGASLLAVLEPHLAGWHPALLDLVRHTDPSTVALLQVRTSVPPAPWSSGPVTLLGDAVHSMTYFRALGANSAIFDAGVLHRELCAWRKGKPLQQAIHDYETLMLAHGEQAVTTSLDAMRRAIGSPVPQAA